MIFFLLRLHTFFYLLVLFTRFVEGPWTTESLLLSRFFPVFVLDSSFTFELKFVEIFIRFHSPILSIFIHFCVQFVNDSLHRPRRAIEITRCSLSPQLLARRSPSFALLSSCQMFTNSHSSNASDHGSSGSTRDCELDDRAAAPSKRKTLVVRNRISPKK